jgi:hypothetical protein
VPGVEGSELPTMTDSDDAIAPVPYRRVPADCIIDDAFIHGVVAELTEDQLQVHPT